MKTQVTVIGGGAAGMAAAYFAALEGAHVVLLEQNEKLGKKVYITGKGRCNVTNTADNPMQAVAHNPRFLHSAFSALNQKQLRDLLEKHGCPTMVERGGRVFPVSEKASDVTKAWISALNEQHVEIRLNSPVHSVKHLLQKGPVIIATGGASYPSTGSTGEGYLMASEAGHHIFDPIPSLIPLETAEPWHKMLQGLSLKNVSLTAKYGKKVRFSEQGEMLFTHFGISGPLVLSMSTEIIDDLKNDSQNLKIWIDLKPAMTPEMLDKRILSEIEKTPNRQLTSILETMAPVRLASVLPGVFELDGRKKANEINKAERRRLTEGLKNLPITVTGTRPLEEAIVTRGGVDVKEVFPTTMESRICKGLFFAGEVLDVDARTGGYNLQIAFSTGALAGRSAAMQLIKGEEFD